MSRRSFVVGLGRGTALLLAACAAGCAADAGDAPEETGTVGQAVSKDKDRKDERREAREARKEERRDAREERKEARKDAREERKEAREEAREERKEAREERKDAGTAPAPDAGADRDAGAPADAGSGPGPVADAGIGPVTDAGPGPVTDAGPGPVTDAGPPVPSNAPPTASITSPSATVSVALPSSLDVLVTASDVDGTVAKVDLYANGALVGTRTTAPYRFRVTPLAAGPYALEARATDDEGAVSAPSTVTLAVGAGAPTFYFVHADHLGTPRALADASGKTVWTWAQGDPFGDDPADEDPDGDGVVTTFEPRFPGQYFDVETGNHYNFFRDYVPSLGRYLQSDPIGLRGGLNTYAYGLASPLVFTDPPGLGPLTPASSPKPQVSNLVPEYLASPQGQLDRFGGNPVVGNGFAVVGQIFENLTGTENPWSRYKTCIMQAQDMSEWLRNKGIPSDVEVQPDENGNIAHAWVRTVIKGEAVYLDPWRGISQRTRPFFEGKPKKSVCVTCAP